MTIELEGLQIVGSVVTWITVAAGLVWIGRTMKCIETKLDNSWTVENQADWQSRTESQNDEWRGANVIEVHKEGKAT